MHWKLKYNEIFHPKGNTYPQFVDVADMDHLWGVVQEATNAPQPHQILFVFQLKTQNNFNFHFFFNFAKADSYLFFFFFCAIPRW